MYLYTQQAKDMIKLAKDMIEHGEYILHSIESGYVMLPSLSEEIKSQFLSNFSQQSGDVVKVSCPDNCTTIGTLD